VVHFISFSLFVLSVVKGAVAAGLNLAACQEVRPGHKGGTHAFRRKRGGVSGQGGCQDKNVNNLLDKGESTLVNLGSGTCYARRFFRAQNVPFSGRSVMKWALTCERHFCMQPTVIPGISHTPPRQLPVGGVQILMYGA
jgi:hypothetical protein